MPLTSVSRPVEEDIAELAPEPIIINGNLGNAPVSARSSARSLIVNGRGEHPENVIEDDTRVRIFDTHEPPYRKICALTISSRYGNFIGTGFFVGKGTILTTGHCVYDQKRLGGWATRITISPGRNGNDRPFGTVDSTKFSALSNWVNDLNADYDIAAIHLTEPKGKEVGWFQLESISPKDLQNYLVNISGYPTDLGRGKEQYFSINRIVRVSDRRIYHEVDTFGGQSGSPVWISKDPVINPIAVAVHAYGDSMVNSAPFFSYEVLEQIKKWVEADDATFAV